MCCPRVPGLGPQWFPWRQSLAPLTCQTAKLGKPGQRARASHRPQGWDPAVLPELPQRPDKCFSLGSSQRPQDLAVPWDQSCPQLRNISRCRAAATLHTPCELWDHTPSSSPRASGEAAWAASSGGCFPHPPESRRLLSLCLAAHAATQPPPEKASQVGKEDVCT